MKDINLFKNKDSIHLKKISNKADISNLDCDGFLIQSSESEARKIIASLKDKGYKGKIALQGRDDAFNRRAIENLKINYLISPENQTSKDTLKQRDSGLNHVVGKIAKEKDIKIIININEITSLKRKERAQRIAKIIQNVKICKKAGCKILIGSFTSNKKDTVDEKSRQSFGTSLGFSSEQARDCIKFN